MTSDIHQEVAGYYTDKFAAYGATPRGVDWNGVDSQQTRFAQLLQVIRQPHGFSINDLGCGYGALLAYMEGKFNDFTYLGYDLSESMIAAAKDQYGSRGNAQFHVAAEPTKIADYGVASGIFNVRLEHNDSDWLRYITSTVDIIHKSTRIGFAFNCLTSYSDSDKKRDYLYYADPFYLFDYCKRHCSPNVSLLHDYGLYEFTIIVRKEL